MLKGCCGRNLGDLCFAAERALLGLSPGNQAMEEAVRKMIGARKRNEVTEVNLDNRCKAQRFAGLEDLEDLELLSANCVGLVTLEGIPKLPKLWQLEVQDNRLTGGLEELQKAPNIEVLKLGGNQIATMEALKPLCNLSKLRNLDLIENPVTQVANYRDQLFKLISSLIVLDGTDADGVDKDADEDDDEDEEFDAEGVLSRPYGRIGNSEADDGDDDGDEDGDDGADDGENGDDGEDVDDDDGDDDGDDDDDDDDADDSQQRAPRARNNGARDVDEPDEAQVRRDMERLALVREKREQDRLRRIREEGWDRFAPVSETNKPPE